MKAYVNVNVYDIFEVMRRHCLSLGIELEGLTVMSFNTEVLRISDGMVRAPVKHGLNPEHSELFKDDE